MNQRSLETIVRLADGYRSLTAPASAAFALALCQYTPLETPVDEKALRSITERLVNPIVANLPLNLNTIYVYLYQLHQYRKQVALGHFPNATGGNGDITWLFGMNTFLSQTLINELCSRELIEYYRAITSVLRDINSSEVTDAFSS